MYGQRHRCLKLVLFSARQLEVGLSSCINNWQVVGKPHLNNICLMVRENGYYTSTYSSQLLCTWLLVRSKLLS